MAAETGRWISAQGWQPSLLLTTPTERTRQTIEEIVLALPSDAPVEERDLPELPDDLEALLGALWARRPRPPVVVCAGHHPMMDLLKGLYTPPVRIPRVHFASAIALAVAGLDDVRCVAAWPGRPAL